MVSFTSAGPITFTFALASKDENVIVMIALYSAVQILINLPVCSYLLNGKEILNKKHKEIQINVSVQNNYD
jgi:cell division protein FtsX